MAIVIQTVSDSAQARKDLGDLKQSVLGIQKSTEGLANKFSNIGKAIAIGTAGAAGAAGLIKLIDGYTNLNNKINSFAENTAAATNALYAINDIAIKTRTSVDATANLYTKLSNSSKDLGATQQQVAAVTRTLNQGFRIQGASAEETRSALTQLGQAFASGKLAGDEFNTVLESAPFLAGEITKGMGISLRELYKLRDEGKLFAKDVFGAILARSSEVERKFNKLAITYGEAFTNLGSSLKMLFNAGMAAFTSERGGPAEMINNWAEGIADFAQNFAVHLLKAKTAAFVFMVDSTLFFTSIWDAIKEGPEGIWRAFNMVIEKAKPYAMALYNVLTDYATQIYAGSSVMFFTFLAWLRKSDATKGVADYIERANDAVLASFLRMSDIIRKIDYGALYENAVNSATDAINRLRNIDFVSYFKDAWNTITSLFSNLKLIDVNKFIPNLSHALDTIKHWAQDAAHWFWWLYDVVIGHSYIPDLVIGVIAWTSKLIGAPVAFVKKFVSIAAGLFASLNPFGALTQGMGIIKKLALAAGAVGLGFGAYKAAKGDLTIESAMDTFNVGADKVSDAVDKFVTAGPIKTTVETGKTATNPLMKTIDNFFNGNFTTRDQNQWTGDVKSQELKRYFLADKLHIPREKQAELAVGLTAAVVGALTLGMKAGTTRSVVISLFTTGALVGIARGIDESVMHKFFVNAANTFINMIGKGFNLLLGRNISEDPFGFLLLIAKFSLLFKAGRDYFLTLAKNIATAPGMVGAAVANRAAYGGQRIAANLAERRVGRMTVGLDRDLDIAKRRFEVELQQLSNSTDAAGNRMGEAAAKLALATRNLPANFVGAQGNLNTALAAQQAQNAAQAARNAPIITRAEAAAKRIREAADATGKKFQEQGQAMRAGITNFGAMAGGVLGTGIGMEIGSQAVDLAGERRREMAINNLTGNKAVTMGGQALNKQQASDVVAGKIKIDKLDEAGRTIAKDIIAGMEVPRMRELFYRLGGMAFGQAAGAMAGAMASTLVIGALSKSFTAAWFLAWPLRKAAEIAFEPIKAGIYWTAFRIQYYSFIAIQATTQKAIQVAAWTAGMLASRFPLIASFVSGGISAATAFLATTVGWPILIGSAIALAVIGAGYMIYKYWDEIKAIGKTFVDLIKEAFTNPVSFFERLPDRFLKVVDKLRSWLPEWLGGTSPDKAPPARETPIPVKRARGGDVTGPGTSRSDSIVAMLSNGEFVVNAKQASKYRGLLHAINEDRELPAFADGGLAGAIQHQVDRHRGGVKVKTTNPKSKKKDEAVLKPQPVVNVSVGIDSGPINNRIGELQQARAEAADRAAKAPFAWQQNMGNELVKQIDRQIATMQEISKFVSTPTTSAVTGGSMEDDADPKKGPKTRVTETDPDLMFSDELNIINDAFPKLKLTMDQYLRLSDEARISMLDKLIPLRRQIEAADKLPANTPGLARWRLEQEDKIRSWIPEATARVNAERKGFASIEGDVEASGLGLTEEQYQMLDPKAAADVVKYLNRMNEWTEQIKKTPENARGIRIEMTKATDLVETMIADQQLVFKNAYERVSHAASKVGADVDKSAFNKLDDAARLKVEEIVDRMVQLQRDIDNDLYKGSDRIAAQKRLEADAKALSALTTNRTDDRYKQAAEDFVAGIRTSFSDGIRNFVKTGKFDFKNLASSFTDRIMDGFLGGLMDNIFGFDKETGNGSFLGKLLGSIGSGNRKAGEGIGQAAGGLDPFAAVTKTATASSGGGIISKVGNFFGGIFGGKKKNSPGNAMAEQLIDKAPTIGSDVAAPLVSSSKEIGKTIGDASKASMTSGLGGATGMASMGGSLLGLLIGNLFSEGGDVKGPGTSKSDSIPAMLSNGEFVVKARQAGKYRGVLHAINNDQIPRFAEGGVVGNASIVDASMIKAIDQGRPANVDASNNKTEINLGITGDVSRQTRREVFGMIPQLASAINAHNKEKGYR